MAYRLHRTPAHFDVRVTTRAGVASATVTNVHPYGARLRFEPGAIDLFSTIVIDFRGQSHAAEVRWMHECEIGVRFAKPLDVETVALIARTIGGAPREKLVRDLAGVRPSDQIHAYLLE
ncbi:MAG: PilZ domain-containing protein [Pseudomonadota bacterium]